MQITAIVSQKGGVGKTTTALQLCAGLADRGLRVLLVDLDEKGNATTGSGLRKDDFDVSVFQVLLNLVTLKQARKPSPLASYDVLPARMNLAVEDIPLGDPVAGDLRLRTVLHACRQDYDHIVLDCPPILGGMTLHALTAAHRLIIPLQCDSFSVEALDNLVQLTKHVQMNYNRGISISGMLRTLFDADNQTGVEISEMLTQHFEKQLLRTIIPRCHSLTALSGTDTRTREADRMTRGGKAYGEFVGEFLSRQPQQTPVT